MDHVELQKMTRHELALFLEACNPSTLEWQMAKRECRRRCERCGVVANAAALSIFAGLLLVGLITLVR